jgi:hypothetical protein
VGVLGELSLLELTVSLTPPRPSHRKDVGQQRLGDSQFAWIVTRAETVSCVIAI